MSVNLAARAGRWSATHWKTATSGGSHSSWSPSSWAAPSARSSSTRTRREPASRILDVADFVDAVRRVADGGTALDPEVIAQLFSRRKSDSPLDRLTPRELEVLGRMAEGRSNAAIAQELVLTVGAVEKHIAGIFTKLRLPPSESDHRRVLAGLAYLRQELD